jgi:predicted nuclease of predicted toxin-antitoxin system
LKLLLDEHYSPAVAHQLRKRGQDVIAAADVAELKNQQDADLLRWAVSERRALLTENARDFIELHKLWLTRRETHYGIVLTTARSYPRSRAGIGRHPRVRPLSKRTFDGWCSTKHGGSYGRDACS